MNRYRVIYTTVVKGKLRRNEMLDTDDSISAFERALMEAENVEQPQEIVIEEYDEIGGLSEFFVEHGDVVDADGQPVEWRRNPDCSRCGDSGRVDVPTMYGGFDDTTARCTCGAVR